MQRLTSTLYNQSEPSILEQVKNAFFRFGSILPSDSKLSFPARRSPSFILHNRKEKHSSISRKLNVHHHHDYHQVIPSETFFIFSSMSSIPSSAPPHHPIPSALSNLPRPISTRPVTTMPAVTRSTTRTPTATATACTQTRQEDSFVVAIIDNTVKDVGLCAYNLHGFDVQMRQFPDSNTYTTLITVLCVFTPAEILLSLSSAGTLLDHAIQACPHLAIVKRTFIGRTYFNETYGALVAENLSNEPCPNLIRLGESSCYLALACCGALIRYIEHVQDLAFTPSSLRVRFQPNDCSVFLDMATLEGLEVVSNSRAVNGLHAPSSSACLLHVLDNTKTRAGKRFLRRSLLEPCADMVTISMRQDAIEELGNSEETYFALVAVLSRFPDLERAMSALMARENARLRSTNSANDAIQTESIEGELSTHSAGEHVPLLLTAPGLRSLDTGPPSVALIQNVLTIKSALQAVLPMLEAIQGSESALLRAISESMRSPALLSLRREISEVIDADAIPAKETERMRMQGAFAIKDGRSGRLDTSRKILSENIEDMQALTDELRKKYGLYKMKLCLHGKRGYHFSIPSRFLDIKDFPDEFIQIDEGKKIHRFSCEELGQLNSRYKDSIQQVWRWTELEIGSLLSEICAPAVLTAIHRLCDSTAILDCITSFVTYSSLSPIQTVRPKLSKDGPVAFQQAFHPILYDYQPQATVANDCYLDETSALHLISGRNQAGKSTLIRQVGLLCIMAYTGCNVPAQYAAVRVLKRIVTAFNIGDAVSQSQSHFSKEMDDVSNIFDSIYGSDVETKRKKRSRDVELSMAEHAVFPNILVLIDELGRSTSTLDGFAIASAVAEKLAACPHMLTMLTTHFLGLGAMAAANPVMKSFCLSRASAEETRNASSQQQLKMTRFDYKVTEGMLTESNYGIETAQLAGIHKEIIDEAVKLRSEIPMRAILQAGRFENVHLILTDVEKLQVRKTFSAVSIAQRLNLIKLSTSDPEERNRLCRELRNKINWSQSRKGSEDRNERAATIEQVHRQNSTAS